MKSFVISIFTLTLIIGGSVLYSSYIESISEEMLGCGEEIKGLIAEENFSEAYEKISELSEFIERKKPVLASTTDHTDTDEAEKTIAELKAYTAEKQKSAALAKCELMCVLFEHFPKNYALRLENIL